MKINRLLNFLFFCTCLIGIANAQCPLENTAFQAGETLNYDLYFNWKFIWVKAGTASLTTKESNWNGENVYRSELITKTSNRIDKFFMMRDTLQCIMQKNIVPLYYKKAANEGGKYYVDEVWYTYRNGSTSLRHKYLSRKGLTSEAKSEIKQCAYDMISMMMRARSFDATQFSVGEKIIFPMADGRKVEDVTLIYRGKKEYKMKGNENKYRCLIFSFVEYEKEKEKEIITFYITDDANHIPVRLDMFLKFGTAKAYLKNYQGLRNSMTSVIE